MNVFNNIKSIIAKHKDNMPVLAVAELLAEIDEAEADCCEWKRAEWNPKHVINSPHKDCMPLNIVDLQNHPYCGHCGKPIKITEVD